MATCQDPLLQLADLRRARDHYVKGVAKLFGHSHVASIEELHDGLTFLDSHRF